MAVFQWNISEGIPTELPGRTSESGGFYQVRTEDFDIAVGNLPFMLNAKEGNEYERSTAPWKKDQFDAERNVGEQSLTGWWLRSQSNFSGGSGITYYEPLLGEGSENRFRDSRGVDVFCESGEVALLREMELAAALGSADVEVVASATRALVRSGSTLSLWDGTTASAVTGPASPAGLAYTGSLFLIGHGSGIHALDATTGSASAALWTGASAAVRPFWAKQRIFAVVGRAIHELTLAGGVIDSGNLLFTHPDAGWTWTSITETGGAVWAAGYSGAKSAVHVITIGDDGATPVLTGSVVGIQLPDDERANALLGYLDFLLVGTSEGLRVAATSQAQASLGPLVFDDEEVFSLTARGDFAWAGLAAGLARKVDLGTEVTGALGFAWANDAEVSAPGSVLGLAWLDDRLLLAAGSSGLYQQSDDLVASGFLTTGFARFGTTEQKYMAAVQVSADASAGTIVVSAGANDPLTTLTTLAEFSGQRDVALHVPGGGLAERLSLTFTLTRDDVDTGLGPVLRSYQLRALPAPMRQRLMRMPLMCFNREKDRWGNTSGGEGFAWERLRQLEALEETGTSILFQDFRTGEARTCVIEQVHFSAPENPHRSEPNFGGTLTLTLRSVA